MDVNKREKFLTQYYSKKIMKLFSDGVNDENDLLKEPISYEEAIHVLEHTISEVKKMPILF